MKLFIIILFAWLFVGCSAYKPPVTYNFNNEKVISDNFDNVWQRSIEWFAEHNTPIKNMDKGTGFISSDYNLDANNSSDCYDCGVPGKVILAEHRLEEPSGNFNVIIKKLGDEKTNVKITCFFSIISRVYMDGQIKDTRKLKCNSTGVMEESFLNYVTRKSYNGN